MASPVVQEREMNKNKKEKKNNKKITRIGSGFNKPSGNWFGVQELEIKHTAIIS